MIIHVGSQNKVKVDAVRLAIKEYAFLADAEVIGIPVVSGVTEQPISIEETVAGARKRAREAFPGAHYSIGLESGIIPVPLLEGVQYLEHTVCALYDGQQFHFGFSPAFPLPQRIMAHVRTGMDLEQACVKAGLTENPELGQAEGIIGLLSKGLVTRTQYTIQAIRMALVALQNQELYGQRT